MLTLIFIGYLYVFCIAHTFFHLPSYSPKDTGAGIKTKTFTERLNDIVK